VDDIVSFNPYEYIYQLTPDGIMRHGIFINYDIINKKMYYTAITSGKFIGIESDSELFSNLNNLNKLNPTTIINSVKSNKYVIKGMTTDFAAKPDVDVTSISYNKRSAASKDIKLRSVVLIGHYVYIEKEERIKLTKNNHDYLIEQLYFTPDILIESITSKMKINVDQPCKLTISVTQLDYIRDFNDRHNYTDSHITKTIYDNKHIWPEKIKMYDNIDIGEYTGNSLIDESTIKLNSQEILSMRTNKYFEFIQPMQYSINRLPKGCTMYSSSLFPFDPTPSGTINMSQFNLIELFSKTNFKVNPQLKARQRTYSLCYNVLKISSGLCAKLFKRTV
jgi:hypothetical protein